MSRFRVTVEFGGRTCAKYAFDQEIVTIGRDASCDVVVDNAKASRHHAVIERTHRGYTLADMSSHNGTYVDGKRVRRHRLEDADRFVIGRYSFVFEQLANEDDSTGLGFESDSEAPLAPATSTVTDLDSLLRRVRGETPTHLVQLAPSDARRTVPLAGHYALIGRSRVCDVRIRGLLAPRRAGMIIRTGRGHRAVGLCWLFRVNGRRADDVPLDDGDLITVARHRFRYCRD